MKKFFALMLTLLMVLMAGSAMADLAEAPFEGVWVQFEDGCAVFQIYDTRIASKMQSPPSRKSTRQARIYDCYGHL